MLGPTMLTHHSQTTVAIAESWKHFPSFDLESLALIRGIRSEVDAREEVINYFPQTVKVEVERKGLAADRNEVVGFVEDDDCISEVDALSLTYERI